MYITNFPPHMESQDLWKMCAEVGTVADVYLARKLSKLGKRFAFVTFLRVQDESELARKLSAIWIGNHHVFATVARFARHERKHELKPFYQQKTTKKEPKKNVNINIVEGKEDRISELPDCLLLEILSRLPNTKFAIRTGALSKRWNDLWTLVPTLIFYYNYGINLPMSDFVSFVNKTLTQCRHLKLKKFEFYTWDYTWDCEHDTESQVKSWIRYAISHDVEELSLILWNDYSFDQSFFINTWFTHLSLSGEILHPIGAISWKNLWSLVIYGGNIDEDMIENILCGSPLLETFELNCCRAYARLNITSKSVKNLVLAICYRRGPLDIVEINAPNILSLTLQGLFNLRKLLLVNISSLVEANLYYEYLQYQTEEEMLKGLILNLRHVKELKIGDKCLEVMTRLEAKGFVFPSNIKFPADICPSSL